MSLHRASNLTLAWVIVLGIGIGGCREPQRPTVPAKSANSDVSKKAVEAQAVANQDGSSPTEPTPITQVVVDTASPALLNDPNALVLPRGHVGSTRCGSCHQAQLQTYLETDHADSFGPVDSDAELSLASFFHTPSRQQYRVKKVAGRVRHQAWQTFPQTPQQLPIADVATDYVVGSGAFAKSYLFRDGESLIQVPLSWYVNANHYDMSPGYEGPQHKDFTREVSDQCLFCHVGSLSRIGGNISHSIVHENAIGCERCHGAGADHSKMMSDRAKQDAAGISLKRPEGDNDLSIVHPAKLSRERLESLCAQCHLQSDVVMYRDGEDAWSYQPGDLLDEKRIEYSVVANGESTKFVGHFDQLRASKCYQQSDSLTCVTCHDPHGAPSAEEKATVHRDQCLQCHASQSCGETLSVRIETNDNSCFECHMPHSKSEVPHIAITNHEIAVYDAKTPDEQVAPEAPDPLKPRELPTLARTLASASDETLANDSWQNERNDAVAIGLWIGLTSDTTTVFDEDEISDVIARLRKSLSAADGVSITPGETEIVVSEVVARSLLCRLLDGELKRYEKDAPATEQKIREEIIREAGKILASEKSPTRERQIAVEMIASEAFDNGRFDECVPLYEQLTHQRRQATDWYHLALTYGRLKRFPDAERAFREAIRIDATYPQPYQSLAKLYQFFAPPQAIQMQEVSDLLKSIGN